MPADSTCQRESLGRKWLMNIQLYKVTLTFQSRRFKCLLTLILDCGIYKMSDQFVLGNTDMRGSQRLRYAIQNLPKSSLKDCNKLLNDWKSKNKSSLWQKPHCRRQQQVNINVMQNWLIKHQWLCITRGRFRKACIGRMLPFLISGHVTFSCLQNMLLNMSTTKKIDDYFQRELEQTAKKRMSE